MLYAGWDNWAWGESGGLAADPLHLPQWARWAPRRAGAGRWWCGCAPAAQPGAAACTRSAGTGKGKGCSGHSAQAASTERARQRRKTHLCFGINFCRMLQKEVNNFYVSVVAADMQRSVSHLEWMYTISKCEYPSRPLTKKTRHETAKILLSFISLAYVKKSSNLGKKPHFSWMSIQVPSFVNPSECLVFL